MIVRRRLIFLCILLTVLPLWLHGQTPVDATGHATHSVLSSGTWYKLTIAHTGVHALTTTELPELEGLRMNSIALHGRRGTLLPEHNSAPRTDDLPLLPIQMIDRNANGIMDVGDTILFYAEGADTWAYSTEENTFVRHRHAYDNYNYCFLTTDAQRTARIATATDTLQATLEDITQYTAHKGHEVDLVNTHNSGRVWVGEAFGSITPQRTISLDILDIVPGTEVKVRYALAAISDYGSRFSLVPPQGSAVVTNFSSYIRYNTLSTNFIANGSPLTFTLNYSANGSPATGYLDYIDACATAYLAFRSGQLDFRSTQHSGTTGNARFRISGAPKSLQVWDVTHYDSICAMPLHTENGTATFCAPQDTLHEYVAFDGTLLYRPENIVRIANQNLHSSTSPISVIVAHESFLPQAERLAALHSVMDEIEVQVVTAEQVYNEFSGGKQDPIAIRNLIRMYKERSYRYGGYIPQYLTLFGKSTYDPRNITGHNLPTVVSYVSPQSFSTESDSYTSDDHFGYLDDDEDGQTYNSLDLGIGRLPAKNSDEATLLVDKIERYMMRSDLSQSDMRGDWRNYITLLADDADPSQRNDTNFAGSSERLSHRIATTYPQYNFDKIFADAYPQQSGAIGSYYPDVNNALKQRLDYGTLLINYIGHGAAQYIGTERYIEFSDINNYSNTHSLFFFVSSTCSYGHADMTYDICGAEALLLAPAAAIGAISAGRPIAHIERFNSDLCYYSLDPEYTIGSALRQAKNNTAMPHCIQLLGDPALHLSLPQHRVAVTHINEEEVRSNHTDSCLVLSRVTITGEVQNTDGTLQSDFSGTLFPIVFDRPTQASTLANDNEGTELEFTTQNNIIYKGRTPVDNGRFQYTFTIPRDIPYQYDYAKLSHYAKSTDGMDATGQYSNLMFGGLDESVVITESRPNIRLYMGDSNFRDGGITGTSPYLYAILEDSIGINAAGCGLGHDITATLDGNGNTTVVLNDFYETDLYNPHRGYLRYALENLSPGRHTLTLRAWNIFNYSASATISFVVRSTDTTQAGHFYSYPNPATQQATLVLECNNTTDAVDAVIDIYDMRGSRMVQLHPTIHSQSSIIGPVTWNLKMPDGRELPAGIYTARAIITTAKQEKITTITKIVKMKQ